MPHVDYIGSDGKPWPSATELLDIMPKDWLWAWYKDSVKKRGWRGWQRNKALSTRGKLIGTEVHGLLESFITKKPYPITGKYPSESIADALFDVVNPLIKTYVELEPHVVSESLRLAGTADLIVERNDKKGLWVGDWKTNYEKSETHPLQLTIYALAWNEQHPKGPKINQGFIARVDKKSARLNVKVDEYLNLKKYTPVIKSLRVLYDYINREGAYNV